MASEAEERKRRRYCEIPECYAFEPVAVETLGGIGDSSWAFLKDLARRIEAQTDEKRSFAFIRQRLGLAVQRGNAACVLQAISDDTN